MIFNSHYNLAGKHAFLSPSNYHWIRYDDEKIDQRFLTFKAAQRGTRLHELAHQAIDLKVRLPRSKTTLNMYVNDAIGFGMTPEQVLFYSDNCFGTADTISFRKDLLRIHDLKTGEHKSSIEQLVVYAAIFCLEYGTKPGMIDIELRIYQNDEIIVHEPEPEEIIQVMDKIVSFDRRINKLREIAKD